MKSRLLSSIALGSVALASTVLSATNAFAADETSPWQFRVRAVVVSPDESATIAPIGGDVDISTSVVPELDISYFFNDNVSTELILGVTKHDVKAVGTALGDVDLGSTWLLPPTLTAQYHFAPGSSFNPYIGAGANLTLFFSDDLPNGSPLVNIDYGSSFGPALQAGADIKLDPDSDWFFNVDVKKVWLNTKVTIDAGALGTVTSDTDIDPWLIGVGFGRRF